MGGVVNKEKAMAQWQELKNAIEKAGCPVSFFANVAVMNIEQ